MQTRPPLLGILGILGIVLLVSGLDPAAAQLLRKTSALSREKGALYIEDATDREIKLITVEEAPVYSTLSGDRRLGVIPAGRPLVIVAVTDKALRVRGRALHDNVVGWIARRAASPLDAKFVDKIKAAAERRKAVDVLIAKKEIAMGMTPEEVEASIGAPTERHSRVDAGGRRDTYDYVTYRTVSEQLLQYDQFGHGYYTLVPRKIETGRRSVDFVNGVVASYTESERLRKRGNGSFVPPPIILDGGW